MKKAIIFELFFFFFTFIGFSFGEINGISDLEKLADKNMEGVQTLSTKYEQKMKLNKKAEMEIKGKMFFSLKGFMKVEMKSSIIGRDALTTIVNDGNYLWTETNIGTLKQIYKMDMKEVLKLRKFSLPGMDTKGINEEQLIHPYKNLEQHYKIKWLGKKQIDGEDLYCIDTVLTEKGQEAFSKMGANGKMAASMGHHQVIYCDSKTGFLRKLVMLNEMGLEIMTMKFSDFEKNPKLSPTFFKYTPPKNIKVIDMTEMVKSMMQNMTKTNTDADKKPAEPEKPKPANRLK